MSHSPSTSSGEPVPGSRPVAAPAVTAMNAALRAERLRSARRAAVLGLVVNGVLALLKGIAGIVGNAYVLVADAIESLTDSVSSLVVWLGLRVASQPADAKYPYGRGRAETLSAVLIALMLFAAAGSIVVQSVHQIQTPHRAPAPFTLIVLVAVIAVKETLFRFVLTVGEGVESTAIKADAWHHRSDAITSAAAFLGICIALWGGPGYETADDWAALLAASIILINGYSILRPALGEMLDRTPDTGIETEVRRLATSVAGVRGTHKCFVRKLGLDFFVDLDLQVDGDMTVKDSHQLAHDVQNVIRSELPLITKVLIHVEPVKSESRSTGGLPEAHRQ